MYVICFASSKGGPGKTTLAASVGVAALAAGERPYLIDLDPQGSLLAWGDRRSAEEPPVDRIAPDRLPAALAGLRGAGYTLAVIDTVGVETAATVEALRAADLTLVPVRPSTLDLEATRPILAALMRLGRPYALVLNSCPPGRSARMEDAGRAIGLMGVLASPAIVQRADHVDALGMGLGVSEVDPEGKAAAEVTSLWGWIKKRIGHGQTETAA